MSPTPQVPPEWKEPLDVRVLVDDPSPWFIVADVCAAIGMPTTRLAMVPEHTRRKAATEEGKVVHLVNAEGLLCLLAEAVRNTSEKRSPSVYMKHVYRANEGCADPMAGRIANAARQVITATMLAYPQRPRSRSTKGLPLIIE